MTERAIAVDVSCACGASAKGLWSGEDADRWAEEHEHDDEAGSPDAS